MGVEEKAAEEKMFEEYQAWCKETKYQKDIAIRDGGDKVEKEEASQQKASADASALTDSVAELDAAIAKATADKKSSTEVRDTERADYEALHADYSESISSMGNAISTISANPAALKNALLQLPEKTQLAVAALQSSAPGFGENQQAFESSSGGILDTLKDMKGEMSDQRSKAEQDEAKQRHAYELMQQVLPMSIEALTDERDSKAAKSAQRQKDAAESGSEGAAAAKTKEEEETCLAEVTATCEQKAADFVQRQELRAEELKAIEKAIDIIGSKSVAGAADKPLPKFVQMSFVALRASTESRMG